MSQIVHRLYRARYPFLAVVVFNAFEILTGQLNVTHGGEAANPLVQAAIVGGDFSIVILARYLALGLLAVGLALDELRPSGYWLLVGLASAFALAALWNVLEFAFFADRWALFTAYAGMLVTVGVIWFDESVLKQGAADPDGYGS